MSKPRQPSLEVRVPASTANLGAGFDCFGLALNLHLTVRATFLSGVANRSRVRSRGAKGSALLARVPEENLIFQAMQRVAQQEGFTLPAIRLAVHNLIPVAGGLGSSAAAIVAGTVLAFSAAGRKMTRDAALHYATKLEGHADNVAAALLGGLAVTAIRENGTVVAIRKDWPVEIRIVAVTPDLALETKKARAVLPRNIQREDAVHNLQRSALLLAALEEKRFDLLWDALQDRLHQHYRESLVPGLGDILRSPHAPGLLGIALSGAGPSIIALANDRFEEIGKSVAGHFERHGLASTVRILDATATGQTTTELNLLVS
jgi:homoserine kinase